MITRVIALPLLAASLFVTVAHAQTACQPEALSAAIDAYGQKPFGAAAWRKLSGLGDPGGQAESYAYSYGEGENWRKLVAEIAPGNETLANPQYDCRMGYPTQVLQDRIAQFGKTSGYVQQWLRGQEIVLKACAGQLASMAEAPMPGNLKPEEADALKLDRAYQEASVPQARGGAGCDR